jgi:phage baseplate assembly protein W
MVKKQYFGIKYPFENESEDNRYVDLNESYTEKMRSELLHLIFTPKGQRYRMPDFGTNLIKYIFEPNDESTWVGIKSEIKEQVSKYLPKIKFKDISFYRDKEDENRVFADISYTVIKGMTEEEDNINIRVI